MIPKGVNRFLFVAGVLVMLLCARGLNGNNLLPNQQPEATGAQASSLAW